LVLKTAELSLAIQFGFLLPYSNLSLSNAPDDRDTAMSDQIPASANATTTTAAADGHSVPPLPELKTCPPFFAPSLFFLGYCQYP
jgi:hypothetical protein